MNDHSSSSYQSDLLDITKLEILRELGSCIPLFPFQTFLDHLAPPQPEFDLNATMQSLKLGTHAVFTSSNQWSKFPKAPEDSQCSEDGLFSSMPEIFMKIILAIVANSGGKLKENHRTVDFFQNPSQVPTSFERNGKPESLPDAYLVLKDAKEEDILWSDIVLSCEYKRDDNLDDNVRKCLWSLRHVMRDDPCRRASFSMTIENSTTRLWFCCRSYVIVSEPFDFVDEPEKLVKLFAAFAFADEKTLGFDPTIQPVPGNRGQFFVTIHPDNDKQNPRRFRTTKILSSHGAEQIRGRGTRVFEAIEIDGNGDSNGLPVVLKDFWVDSDRTREGNILASIHAAADDDDKPLIEKHFLTTICHGDVWTEPDILDDTANALMRGLNITPDHDSLFKLRLNPFLYSYEPPSGSHETHYRIVFREKGITIGRLRSLSDVMTVLTETINALRLLRKLGWVHRDVSIGNILSYDGHAKLMDLEYAKKMSDLKGDEKRTGTMHFMSIEVAAHLFLFPPSDPEPSLTELDQFVSATYETDVPFSHNHLHDLESLWWVAVWVVFYNYFSEGMPSGDRPSITLREVEDRLQLAQILFPPALDSISRRNGFQLPMSFQNTCKRLPGNKTIYAGLDLLRRLLIKNYSVIEAGYPLSVDPSSSKDDIYDDFARIFSKLKTVSHDVVLDFIPDIYEKLLKGELREDLKKRARSESTSDTEVARE